MNLEKQHAKYGFICMKRPEQVNLETENKSAKLMLPHFWRFCI